MMIFHSGVVDVSVVDLKLMHLMLYLFLAKFFCSFRDPDFQWRLWTCACWQGWIYKNDYPEAEIGLDHDDHDDGGHKSGNRVWLALSPRGLARCEAFRADLNLRWSEASDDGDDDDDDDDYDDEKEDE